MLTLNTLAANSHDTLGLLKEAANNAGLGEVAKTPDAPISSELVLKLLPLLPDEVVLELLPRLPPEARKYVEGIEGARPEVQKPSQSVGSLQGKPQGLQGVAAMDPSVLGEIALLESAPVPSETTPRPVPSEASLGVRLDKISGRSVASGGWFSSRATKVRVANEGFKKEALVSLQRLSRPDGKSPSLKAVLSDMKTLQKHLDRLVALGTMKPAEMDDALLASLQPMVEKLSNAELSGVWQTLCSAELTGLKEALQRRAFEGKGAKDAKAALGTLMTLEAVVLREISRRVALAAPPAKSDLSPANLKTLVEVASGSATLREKTAEKTTSSYEERGVEGLEPKLVGDVMRNAELTMNITFEALFGFATDDKPALIDDPNLRTWSNAHHLKARNVPGFTDVYMERRVAVEDALWPELSGHAVNPDERPVYAALNLQQRVRGAAPSSSYGGCVLVMKDSVKQRCTYTIDDTFFAVRLQLSDERIARFFALAAGMGDRIDPRLAAALADPKSPEREALTAWFQKVGAQPSPNANDMEGLGGIVAGSNDAVNYKARFGKDKEGDDLRLEALAVEVFADKLATRESTATFDNLESLIPHMSTATADGLVYAAVNGAQNGAACLGTNYIEAQVHGPFELSRDVAALRVPLELLENEAEGDAVKLAGVKQRLLAFGERHGIDIEIIDDRAIEESDIAVEELRSGAEQFSLGLDARKFDDACAALLSSKPEVLDGLIDKAVVQGKYSAAERLPEGVKMIQGATLGRLLALTREEMDREKTRGGSVGKAPEVRAEQCLLAAASRILGEKQVLLDKLEALPFDSPAQRTAFAKWVVSAKALRDPNELAVIHEQAFALRDGLRSLADGPKAPADVLALLDGLFTQTATDILAWSKTTNKDFGKDDLITTLSRTTSLAGSLLELTDGVGEAERTQMLSVLTSPALALRNQALEVLGASLATASDEEKQRMIGTHEMLTFSALAVAKGLGKSEREVFAQLEPKGRDELMLEAEIPLSVRTDLAKIFPASIAALNTRSPAPPSVDVAPLANNGLG